MIIGADRIQIPTTGHVARVKRYNRTKFPKMLLVSSNPLQLAYFLSPKKDTYNIVFHFLLVLA